MCPTLPPILRHTLYKIPSVSLFTYLPICLATNKSIFFILIYLFSYQSISIIILINTKPLYRNHFLQLGKGYSGTKLFKSLYPETHLTKRNERHLIIPLCTCIILIITLKDSYKISRNRPNLHVNLAQTTNIMVLYF